MLLTALLGCTAPPIGGATKAPLEWQERGTATFVDGQVTLELEAPAGAQTMAVLLENAPLHVGLTVQGWTSPDSTWIPLDAGRPPTLAEQRAAAGTTWGYGGACRVQPSYGAAVFMCPHNGELWNVQGTHTLQVRAWERATQADGGVTLTPWSGEIGLAVRFGRQERFAPDEEVPVRVHVPWGLGLEPNAQPPAGFTHTWQVAAGLLRPLGVRPILDLRAGTGRTDLVVEGETLRSAAHSELALLCEAARGVDVFVVERLAVWDVDGLERDVPAFSSSIPVAAQRANVAAPVLLAGHWRTPDAAQEERLGVRLAHELGHAWGLFHLREVDEPDGSFVTDGLGDTPDGALDVQTYLMHRVPLAQSSQVSATQADVVGRSAVLK